MGNIQIQIHVPIVEWAFLAPVLRARTWRRFVTLGGIRTTKVLKKNQPGYFEIALQSITEFSIIRPGMKVALFITHPADHEGVYREEYIHRAECIETTSAKSDTDVPWTRYVFEFEQDALKELEPKR